ncbi:hypothetical protein BKA81DRAFT_366705 [Phyllosticta paracitricarpa]
MTLVSEASSCRAPRKIHHSLQAQYVDPSCQNPPSTALVRVSGQLLRSDSMILSRVCWHRKAQSTGKSTIARCHLSRCHSSMARLFAILSQETQRLASKQKAHSSATRFAISSAGGATAFVVDYLSWGVVVATMASWRSSAMIDSLTNSSSLGEKPDSLSI